MKVDKAHLTYCTNIYAGESWPEHFEALKDSFPAIKEKISPLEPMGIGLRLSNVASLELMKEDNLNAFKEWLKQNDGYVFTMNGFPYGEFHRQKIKDQVHAPDWRTPQRLEYTIRLFHILAELLPEKTAGGVSTSPLSYKYWFGGEEQRSKARELATWNVLRLVEELIRIRRSRGIVMHLDIEPEPDGLLETGAEFIQWFGESILMMGKEWLAKRLNCSIGEAETYLKEHLCLCYDICHFAVGYEPHEAVLEQLRRKGIKVGKIQISAALSAILPAAQNEREAVVKAFSSFEEPVYLHQVVARCEDGTFIRYRDIPKAAADSNRADVVEWRAHFHVPVFIESVGCLQSTQADILRVFESYKETPFSSHLEVETYTWEVLPASLKRPLTHSIVRELEWIKRKLTIK